MLKREWGAESNGKLPHLFIPDKTAAFVPEFAEEDQPSAELQPLCLSCSEGPAFGQNTDDDIYNMNDTNAIMGDITLTHHQEQGIIF